MRWDKKIMEGQYGNVKTLERCDRVSCVDTGA